MYNKMNGLDNEAILKLAPAAMSEVPAAHMSERYQMVHTYKALDIFRDAGYIVNYAGQDRPTRRKPTDVRHMLTLIHRDDLQKSREVVPQILYVNSHNGRTKCRMMAGFYRFVCANGLIIGNENSRVEIIHKGIDVVTALHNGIEHTVEEMNRQRHAIENWREITVPRKKQIEYASAALVERFGEDGDKKFNPEDILIPKRKEDEGDNLWLVYNRVQEHLTQSSLQGRNANNRAIRSRPLTQINRNQEVNEWLWREAEKLAA